MFGKLLELSSVLLGWESGCELSSVLLCWESGCILVVFNCSELDIEGSNELAVY
jgi:hypothetical protein